MGFEFRKIVPDHGNFADHKLNLIIDQIISSLYEIYRFLENLDTRLKDIEKRVSDLE